MGGGVPGLPLTRPGFCIVGAAGLRVEFEMKAAWAARYGRSAVVGLAVHSVSLLLTGGSAGGAGRLRLQKCVPRSARALAVRVVENIVRGFR